MKRGVISLIFLLIGLAIGGSVMWVYTKPAPTAKEAAPVKKERKVLFYRHPMNPQVTSPTPRKDEMGMDYVPVYEEEKTAKAEKKILFYRNPMNPSATSPTPMKDSMGMDYIPVYEEEAAEKEAPGTVSISPEKIQKIGVKSEEVKRRPLKHIIRTVGRVEPVEDKVYTITSKVPGWIEKLYVDRTDLMVHPGEPLLELYSPDLLSAQEEYLIAMKNAQRARNNPNPDESKRADSLLAASAQRLKYWDISDDQIRRLAETGNITRTMAIRAPAHGGVTEKMVVQGQKIEAGEPLFKVIDHSVVWVYGEIYEYEIPYIKVGEHANLTPSYSPSEVYRGRIDHVYSHLGSIRYVPEGGTEIRTAKVRFELPNENHRLKLGMYLNVELEVHIGGAHPSVSDSAVIDTGTRQVVIVDRRDGTFEPRDVRLGAHAEGYYEVLGGVREGDWVVTSANFLIDSESNLRAALGGMARHGGDAHEKGPARKEPLRTDAEKPAAHEGH